MSNFKPNFLTVIKTSISSIMKHPMNICPNSKRSTNQRRITFQLDISKPHLLSFLHSMYNPIKFSNQSSLNFKKHRKSSNKFSHTPTESTFTSTKTKISHSSPLVLILTQPSEGNSHLTGRGCKTLPARVLISKKLSTLKSNISFFIKALDELST